LGDDVGKKSNPYRKKQRPSKVRVERRLAYSDLGRSLAVGKALQEANLPYAPKTEDWLILAAVLAGSIGTHEIAEVAGMQAGDVKARLLDPAFARWLAERVELELPSRLGLVDLAVYARALKSGDVARARYLAERFGKLRRQPTNPHYHLHLNLDKLSEEQLVRLVEEKRRLLGLTQDGTEEETESE